MFRNYFKIGIRNLAKNRLFSLINISGMAISIASFLIISLFIYDELKFDKHVEDADLKYRVYNEHFEEERNFAVIPPIIGTTLVSEFPEVEYCTRFMAFMNPPLFEVGERKFTEGKGGYADPSIFEMFSLKLLEGNMEDALQEPNSIAINQSLKQKYFGGKPAFGENIKIDDQDFNVVAVYEDFPTHAHLQLNYFISMERFALDRPDRMEDWGWSGVITYIKLNNSANATQLENKLQDYVEGNAGNNDFYISHLMPLQKVYLYASNQAWDVALHGNIQTIYILLAAAFFILLISVLNFVNLSTARAVNRVKEVGLRKVVGAMRIQLIYQFISESVLITLLALSISVILAIGILPSLNSFTEKDIPISVFLNPQLIFILLGFALVVGVTAGSYPAFYISGFRPAHLLVNRQSGSSGRAFMRKGLVVLQFVLSFFLIVASLTVYQQYNFMRDTDMGFNKNNIVVLKLRSGMSERLETTKQIFSNHPNILSASLGYGLPGEAYAGETIMDKATSKNFGVSMLFADHDYMKTLGLELLAGRGFHADSPSDESQAFVLSETAAKMLGYNTPEDALGHELDWELSNEDSMKRGKVIGVVKDIQLNSMRESVAPVVLHIYPMAYSTIMLRINPRDVPATIEHLEKAWNTLSPEWPFEYKFLDENFDKMYKSEEKLATLFMYFALFTIFVACLGLFGLVVYNTSQKYKEISIRKVLGAKEENLVVQLAKGYVLLLGIAFLISIPFSYYAAWQWLQKFAYRIPITPMLFIQAGLFIMVISLLTVGLQSFKAARANPVDALKEQ
jgi:putative ABC transport system permease protein